MKKNLFLSVVVLSALLTGCCKNSVTSDVYVPPVPRSNNAEVQDLAFSVGDEAKAKLRLKIVLGSGSKDFSRKLFEEVSDDLLSEAQIGAFQKYDGIIRIGNEFEVKDKTGEYFRVICKGIRIEMFFGNQLKMAKNIRLRPLPRKLGLDNAVEQYLPSAAREVSKFLSSRIAAVNREKLAVREIAIKISGSAKGGESAFSREVDKVARVISSINGVINYQNIAQDPASGSCTFRIVYSKEQMPQGIRNVLNNKLTELK